MYFICKIYTTCVFIECTVPQCNFRKSFFSVIYFFLQPNSNFAIHEVIVHFMKFYSRLTGMAFFGNDEKKQTQVSNLHEMLEHVQTHQVLFSEAHTNGG